MEQVGYDMYCKLLDEVMKEMQGNTKEIQNEEEIQIDINVSSYIPEDYIENSDMKIGIYQDIALCKNENELLDITDEIIDRFGNIPKEVENLIEIARIKNMCKDRAINKIIQRGRNIVVYLIASDFDVSIVEKLTKEYKQDIKFSPSALPYITYKIDENKSIIKQVKDFLSSWK